MYGCYGCIILEVWLYFSNLKFLPLPFCLLEGNSQQLQCRQSNYKVFVGKQNLFVRNKFKMQNGTPIIVLPQRETKLYGFIFPLQCKKKVSGDLHQPKWLWLLCHSTWALSWLHIDVGVIHWEWTSASGAQGCGEACLMLYPFSSSSLCPPPLLLSQLLSHGIFPRAVYHQCNSL